MGLKNAFNTLCNVKSKLERKFSHKEEYFRAIVNSSLDFTISTKDSIGRIRIYIPYKDTIFAKEMVVMKREQLQLHAPLENYLINKFINEVVQEFEKYCFEYSR